MATSRANYGYYEVIDSSKEIIIAGHGMFIQLDKLKLSDKIASGISYAIIAALSKTED